jgi:flagellar motility protein MotE (MotC chaperone)
MNPYQARLISVSMTLILALSLDTSNLLAQSAQLPRENRATNQHSLIPEPEPAERFTPAQFEVYCKAVYEEIGVEQENLAAEELKKVSAEVDARVTVLDKTIETLKEWIAKREAFRALAQDSIVRVYAQMQPESAASQLVAMPEDVAAAIVMKLDPKRSGTILTEMEAAKAARLTSLIAAAGEFSTAQKAAASKDGK